MVIFGYFGAGRQTSNNSYFNVGQVAGDLLSIVTGAIEVVVGYTGAGGGLALAPATGGISVVTGAAVSTAGLAVAGYLKNGVRASKIFNYFGEVAQYTGKSITQIAETFGKNAFFKQSRLTWSAGKAGDSLGSLVGHYEKHGASVGAKSVDVSPEEESKRIDNINFVLDLDSKTKDLVGIEIINLAKKSSPKILDWKILNILLMELNGKLATNLNMM